MHDFRVWRHLLGVLLVSALLLAVPVLIVMGLVGAANMAWFAAAIAAQLLAVMLCVFKRQNYGHILTQTRQMREPFRAEITAPLPEGAEFAAAYDRLLSKILRAWICALIVGLLTSLVWFSAILAAILTVTAIGAFALSGHLTFAAALAGFSLGHPDLFRGQLGHAAILAAGTTLLVMPVLLFMGLPSIRAIEREWAEFRERLLRELSEPANMVHLVTSLLVRSSYGELAKTFAKGVARLVGK